MDQDADPLENIREKAFEVLSRHQNAEKEMYWGWQKAMLLTVIIIFTGMPLKFTIWVLMPQNKHEICLCKFLASPRVSDAYIHVQEHTNIGDVCIPKAWILTIVVAPNKCE